ncbi:MAG: hypothetical protein JW704_02370 [Anaerolineaceae bacterium]|nr:hypothetical protein [Anaerolineaceae bacterium]MBN2676817.1 hypothetical protein [Anaerolineaceae bacterium]
MGFIREAFVLIKNNRKVFNLINIAYFSIVIVGMLIIRTNMDLRMQLLDQVGDAFTSGPMQNVTGAYTDGQIILAIGLTFIVNLVLGCFITITLPSLIIPFSGFIMGVYRPLLWGFLFSPDMGVLDLTRVLLGIGIGLLLVLEGEAYVLALFTAFLHGRAWVKPASVGGGNHRQGYLTGIRLTLHMYLLIICMLLIAAIYEVILVILVMPVLS